VLGDLRIADVTHCDVQNENIFFFGDRRHADTRHLLYEDITYVSLKIAIAMTVTPIQSIRRMALRRLISSKRLTRTSRAFHASAAISADALDMCDTFSRRHGESKACFFLLFSLTKKKIVFDSSPPFINISFYQILQWGQVMPTEKQC